jgi:hypothetical protein
MDKTAVVSSPPRIRHKRKLKVKKKRFRKALIGSGGIKSEIARRLGVTRQTVIRCLKLWPDIRARYEQARQEAIDECESTLFYCAKQRRDLSVAASTARFVLTTLRRKRFGEATKRIQLSGDRQNPLRTFTTNKYVEIPEEDLIKMAKNDPDLFAKYAGIDPETGQPVEDMPPKEDKPKEGIKPKSKSEGKSKVQVDEDDDDPDDDDD